MAIPCDENRVLTPEERTTVQHWIDEAPSDATRNDSATDSTAHRSS